jgi:hypothetical protein
MIIFGNKTKHSRAKPDKVLKKACPLCKGNLRLYDVKKWFTLYFIPVFPYSTVDNFYGCDECKEMYATRIEQLIKMKKKQVATVRNHKK